MRGSDNSRSIDSLDARHGLPMPSGHNDGAPGEAPTEARRKSPPHPGWSVGEHTSVKRSRHGIHLHGSDEPPQINSRSVSMGSDLSVDTSDLHSWSQSESLESFVSYCGTEPESEPRRSAGMEGAALSSTRSHNAPHCYGWPSQGQATSFDGGFHQSKTMSDGQLSSSLPNDTKTFMDGRIQQLSQGYGQQQQLQRQHRKQPQPQPQKPPPPKQTGPPKPDPVASDWNALDDEEFTVGPGLPRQVGFVIHVKGNSKS